MFDNKRYITNGVKEEVPGYLQNIMWYMIETMAVKQKDYLQVFDLKPILSSGVSKQQIIHTQECPPYKFVETFTDADPIITKVFVIDDETHATMLLAKEY